LPDICVYFPLQADLFRYLVLLRDGGVWADIDILLETNLDAFIAPNLSFFAPRDVVCTYADEAFCLWNGFMGSAPGHPVIVKAAENTVNFISQRADFYDIESDLCKKNGLSLASWKYRSEPSLTLSGPCALGIAVNEALNRSSLATIPFGLLKSPNYDDRYGDVLILVVRTLKAIPRPH
jgi:Capsular polysaccharide synthesis protein